MNIVFLNPSGELGGAEAALLDMLAALREARPLWTLGLVASAEGSLLARARALNIPSFHLEFPPSLARLGEWGRRGAFGRVRLGAQLCAAALPTMSYLGRLRRQLSGLSPDIVHTNGLKMHLLGAHSKPRDSKLIWHLHDYPQRRPITERLLARDAYRCAAVLANSSSVAKQAEEVLGSTTPVHTVYNAIDFDRFSPDGPSLDLDALAGLTPLGPGGVRIGLIATFARWKGHEVFLEAVSRLGSKTPFRAYIIGGPIYQTSASQYSQAELRQRATALGLGNSVGFTGKLDDVPGALRALDIVVHASVEPEPFGLVIAEAMACGRPVVASNAGGAAEAGLDAALFHTPGSSAELADRLTQLMCNPLLRGSLGDAGRTIALTRFSRHRLAGTLIPIYEALGSSRS